MTGNHILYKKVIEKQVYICFIDTILFSSCDCVFIIVKTTNFTKPVLIDEQLVKFHQANIKVLSVCLCTARATSWPQLVEY